MAEITKLSSELANKIAAGEVVERPASVVKELAENAIDAGSTRIAIGVKEGGLAEIRITDNGTGMTKQDAELSFSRHATSKIKTEMDLFRISTLGFRGEALPSIAAVSHLELETGNGEGAGTLIRYQGGKRITCTAAKGRSGTEMIVRDLFFNTPARLKHMKTINTELSKITDVVNRLALANPFISFELSHNGRQLLFTNGSGDVRAVIAAIYGRYTAQQFLPIRAATDDYTIEGFVAKPEVTRASRQHFFTIINGRYIRHFPLTKAIEQAYHTLLPIGRHPLAVLHIQMDPVLIDVNVHPSKLEVRLSKEQELTRLLEETIKKQLHEETLIPEVDKKRGKQLQSEQVPFHFSSVPVPQKEPEPQSFLEDQNPLEQKIDKEEAESVNNSSRSIDTNNTIHESKADFSKENSPLNEQKEKMAASTRSTSTRFPVLELIGQFHGTYILTQNEEGLYIIDQHAAQERIFYEYYRERIAETKPELQELMVPLTLEFSAVEETIVQMNQSKLEEVGVFLEPFGQRTYRVSAYPVWFPSGEEESTIRELLEQLKQGKKISIQKLREAAAILMSCKAAIKANRYLRQDEMQALITRLGQCEVPFTCPHGRPILIHFSSYDMEKMFKRIM
ncbi:DNA mismatch repair endonuclease MutL [Bacillus piscicola]|uniref:DNA mismatch repair endonuclease MutL n=1 Tax=Bacillus piscicola TaxID=1632684 RepID=UPI001F091194|nr:DNA mismatch repair endonuclease MutL [Bacillus piscicola]